ncbi:class I SAM-dependent methyltransferase [Carboxylicivirga sediminis]|uniref:Class I SAM-dependent methyltransferase n=1 Tax=Carboxylicivirga sediminis TaxID=2006564 RepID=A0A941F5N4_9BACT|nr:class I SAM-dependent methyltransferase [Carboxylicivirga sediminis]MBR8537261.1 class I SAM-dependent methyltransferase [Carboxylicivirga sediminis]
MKEMWNERYESKDYFYGTEPNSAYKSFIDNNTPGKLLLPAEGEGRNAVYAATKGWDVTAIDFSEEARKKALNLAKSKNTSITYHIGDVQQLEFQAHTFDYIACVFMHLPSEQLQLIYKRLMNLLKPQGLLLIVGFNKNQLKYSSGGPRNEDWLFSAENLKDQFNDCVIIQAKDYKTTLNEGNGHEGVAEITIVEIKKE